MVGNPRAVAYVTSEAGSKAATARARDRQFRTITQVRSRERSKGAKGSERPASKSKSTTHRGTRKRDKLGWRDSTWNYD